MEPAVESTPRNTDYLKTPAGLLRVGEAAAAIAGIISATIGCYCYVVGFGFFLFVTITSFLQALLVLVMIILRLEQKLTIINVPLTLLVNDMILLPFTFLSTTLILFSIGSCHRLIFARIAAALFSISGFLFLVCLSYTDYQWFLGEKTPSNNEPDQVTESSPTVHTLS